MGHPLHHRNQFQGEVHPRSCDCDGNLHRLLGLQRVACHARGPGNDRLAGYPERPCRLQTAEKAGQTQLLGCPVPDSPPDGLGSLGSGHSRPCAYRVKYGPYANWSQAVDGHATSRGRSTLCAVWSSGMSLIESRSLFHTIPFALRDRYPAQRDCKQLGRTGGDADPCPFWPPCMSKTQVPRLHFHCGSRPFFGPIAFDDPLVATTKVVGLLIHPVTNGQCRRIHLRCTVICSYWRLTIAFSTL